MKTIWKYELKIEDEQEIKMPFNAQILSVQVVQFSNPCIWVIVNSDVSKQEVRLIKIVKTGNPFDTDKRDTHFIGTFQIGSFVGHVFEIIT